MRTKVLGYIVIGPSSHLYRLAPNDKKNAGGIWTACGGQPATVFPTRRAAQIAIDTAIIYATKEGYAWESWMKNAYIYPVVAA